MPLRELLGGLIRLRVDALTENLTFAPTNRVPFHTCTRMHRCGAKVNPFEWLLLSCADPCYLSRYGRTAETNTVSRGETPAQVDGAAIQLRATTGHSFG
jgi:hypothetical protein